MKILLACSAGMSTSLLVNNMKKFADASDVIEARPVRTVPDILDDWDVLLLISIADGEHPELQKFYLSITSFMQDTARVKSLIQCRDYPWFMRLLCGENGGSRENKTQKQNSKTQKEYESL